MNFEQIAQRIKGRCKEKGYTIKEMLEYCEYNRNFMYDLKCGKNFSLKTFAKLAKFLDCSIDYLIGRTDNPDINKWLRLIVCYLLVLWYNCVRGCGRCALLSDNILLLSDNRNDY